MDITSLLNHSDLILMNPLLLPLLLTIGGSVLSSIPGFVNMAKGSKLASEGQWQKQQAMQSMDALLKQRQAQYQNLYKMLFGNSSYNQMFGNQNYGFSNYKPMESKDDVGRASTWGKVNKRN